MTTLVERSGENYYESEMVSDVDTRPTRTPFRIETTDQSTGVGVSPDTTRTPVVPRGLEMEGSFDPGRKGRVGRSWKPGSKMETINRNKG